MIEKNVKLWLGDGPLVTVRVSQFDTMWRFVFSIIHNSQPWQIPTGATAVLNGRKPDGNVFAFSGAIENNTVTVDADVQMTAVAGQTVCELSILSDSKTIGTANFILDVEEAPKSADDVVSDTVLDGYGMMVTNAVDDWMNSHSGQIGGLTNEAKQALLTLLAHVAYTDDQGQAYLDALETALYPPVDLLSISAVFNQGDAVIYETDELDSLKQYLTVTANMSDGTTQTVSNYTLSGTLMEGTSTITVSYGGKTDTFDVTVTEYMLYSLQNHIFNNSSPIATGLKLLENDRDITFAVDVDFAGQQSGALWNVFGIMNPSGNYEGLAIQAPHLTSNDLLIQNMTNRSTITKDMRSYVGNFKYIVTHNVGSGNWHYYYKIGSASVVDATVTSAFKSVTGGLTVGGTASGSQVFNGTVNKFNVYPRVLTSSEITAFMG